MSSQKENRYVEGFEVMYDGKTGIMYRKDQNKDFKCPCCGSKQDTRGKKIIVPTENGREIDGKKVLVSNEKIKILRPI